MRSPLRIGFLVIYEFAAVPPIHTMRTGTADSHFALVKRADNYKCGNDKNNNRNYLLEKGDIVYIWRMKNRMYSSYAVGTASKEFNRKAEHRISQQVYFQDIRLGPFTSRTAYCSASAAERPPGRCAGPAETPVSPAGCSWTEIPWWR